MTVEYKEKRETLGTFIALVEGKRGIYHPSVALLHVGLFLGERLEAIVDLLEAIHEDLCVQHNAQEGKHD